MSTVFSKIAQGKIPSYKIAENDSFFAFLDINPLTKGHTLVIPKSEIDYPFDMDDDNFTAFFLFSKKVALAIEKVIECKKIGLAVVGLEVPHAHIHLVPINSINDLNFNNPKLKLSDEEFKIIANSISETFNELFTSFF